MEIRQKIDSRGKKSIILYYPSGTDVPYKRNEILSARLSEHDENNDDKDTLRHRTLWFRALENILMKCRSISSFLFSSSSDLHEPYRS